MIRLSAKTEYALRAMMDLSERPDARTTFPAIAERQGIPRKFLPTVLQSLTQAGYVRTIRGYGGGVELTCDPERVTIRQVIENVEGPQRLHDCDARGMDCDRTPNCHLRKTLERAGNAMMEVLDGITLAEVAPPTGGGVFSGATNSLKGYASLGTNK
ncbi:MAG: RrF2 family transcriptional regulator [Armatimonadota bacterium]